jgi:phosphomannomutase/phosphoglucomutase
MRIVVDGGNGIAGPVNCTVLAAVGCDVHELFTEPDGTFPNHPADPSKHETLKDLQKEVKEKGARFGIAYDGDGDRLGIVDELGNVRTADEILLLLARDHLQRFPGAPVVFTVSNSSILESEIKQWGGKPVMCKVGHSHVEHAMRENGAALGGEQSGHFFCGENYFGFDDALVAALHILRIAGARDEPLSKLFADFPKVYPAPERRPFCPDDRKADIVKRASEHFAKTYPVNTLDGARIDFGSGAWAGIRFSNTSPCLSICIEARSEKKLKEIEAIVLEHLRTYPEIEW